MKLFLKFIDNRRNKKKGLKKLQSLRHKLSENDIQMKKKKNHHSELMDLKKDDILNIIKKAKSSKFDYNDIIRNDHMVKNNDSDEENFSEILEEKNLIELEKREKILKKLEEISELLDTSKLEHYINFYSEKLKIVDDFFLLKLNDYIAKFEHIKEKINKIKNNNTDIESSNDSEHHERDEFGYATSWKRALSTLYTYTSWLHSYHSINILAIQKIQKKSKKIFKIHNIYGLEKEFKKVDDKFAFFNILNRLIELRMNIKQYFAEQFTDGNLKQAKKELHKGLLGHEIIKPISYFYIGIIIAFVLFYLF